MRTTQVVAAGAIHERRSFDADKLTNIDIKDKAARVEGGHNAVQHTSPIDYTVVYR